MPTTLPLQAGPRPAASSLERINGSVALIEVRDLDSDPFIQVPEGFGKLSAHDQHVWKHATRS
jgi:hypothetical protein